ncbi:MAG TPA: periplasmic heavy metal sensor [Vicinamibacterales bacterium]|nr:periplasmic heavy metal sensor [Vicinamibacterales bacterium]
MMNAARTAVVAAVAAVFVASVALAGGDVPQNGFAGGAAFDAPFGQGRGPGMGGPGPGRGMTPWLMRDLTDQQREQIRAIMQEQRQQGPPADAGVRRELEAELLADVPNAARIDELKQRVLQHQAEQLNRHVEVQKRIAQVLTPEQRAKARERLSQERPARGRGPRR